MLEKAFFVAEYDAVNTTGMSGLSLGLSVAKFFVSSTPAHYLLLDKNITCTLIFIISFKLSSKNP